MSMKEFEDIINNIDNYVVDGAESYTVNGKTYSGYGKYIFWWEKTFWKSPERAQNGAMGNLDTYATFKTAHAEITYSPMPIDTYREFMEQYLNGNEYTVTLYDTIFKKKITRKMYYGTPSKPNYIYRNSEKGVVELVGVDNFTVEIIGTNNDADEE